MIRFCWFMTIMFILLSGMFGTWELSVMAFACGACAIFTLFTALALADNSIDKID